MSTIDPLSVSLPKSQGSLSSTATAISKTRDDFKEEEIKWDNLVQYYADLLERNEILKKKLIQTSLRLSNTVQLMLKHDIYAQVSTLDDIRERMKDESHITKAKKKTHLMKLPTYIKNKIMETMSLKKTISFPKVIEPV